MTDSVPSPQFPSARHSASVILNMAASERSRTAFVTALAARPLSWTLFASHHCFSFVSSRLLFRSVAS